MIGRDGPVEHFALLRWAREQARLKHHDVDGEPQKLKPLEAHVLLVLATYANADGEAWPSIKKLALDCGLKPTRPKRTDDKASAYRNSAISAALDRLQELQLIWSKQSGPGRPAIRELLFNPALPSGTADGNEPSRPSLPSGTADGLPSALADQKYPEGRAQQRPEEPNSRRTSSSHPAGRTATDPAHRTAKNGIDHDSRDQVRAAIDAGAPGLREAAERLREEAER